MIELVILGAGGTARDVLDWIADSSGLKPRYKCLGLLDDDRAKQGKDIAGYHVLGPLADAAKYTTARFVDALGGPGSFRKRSDIVGRTSLPDKRFATLVHPLASVSPRARLGAGSLVYPFAFLGPEAAVGRHVTILSHSAVNHGSRIGDWSILASHVALAGDVLVGEQCYLGMGCSVIGGAKVGDGSMVGMGAVVIGDVAPGSVVAGNPARPLATS